MLKRGSEKLGKKDCAQFTGYSSKKKNIYIYICVCMCVCVSAEDLQKSNNQILNVLSLSLYFVTCPKKGIYSYFIYMCV